MAWIATENDDEARTEYALRFLALTREAKSSEYEKMDVWCRENTKLDEAYHAGQISRRFYDEWDNKILRPAGRAIDERVKAQEEGPDIAEWKASGSHLDYEDWLYYKYRHSKKGYRRLLRRAVLEDIKNGNMSEEEMAAIDAGRYDMFSLARDDREIRR